MREDILEKEWEKSREGVGEGGRLKSEKKGEEDEGAKKKIRDKKGAQKELGEEERAKKE